MQKCFAPCGNRGAARAACSAGASGPRPAWAGRRASFAATASGAGQLGWLQSLLRYAHILGLMPYAEELSRGCREQFLWLQGLEDAAKYLKKSKKYNRLASSNTLAIDFAESTSPKELRRPGPRLSRAPGSPIGRRRASEQPRTHSRRVGQPMASTAATHRRRWSQAEKDVCAAGVKKFGAFNHRRIAQLVGTRSKAQVRTYLYAAGYRKLGAAPFYTTVDRRRRRPELRPTSRSGAPPSSPRTTGAAAAATAFDRSLRAPAGPAL